MRALIFDLDGTLIDTNYAHVLAWQKAFAVDGFTVPASSIHGKIGLGGTILAGAVGLELGRHISPDQAEDLDTRHGNIMKELLYKAEPLPGAIKLLQHLSEMGVPYGIATSGRRADAEEPLRALKLSSDIVVVCKSDVERAKPDPDLILACQQRLDVAPKDCFVVGDTVWDMLAARRSGMLGVGLLTGGIGMAELTEAGAYRVYRDPAELDGRRYELSLTDSQL
jgi:HAD superfamily hydrolase (TIGR01509 family)